MNKDIPRPDVATGDKLASIGVHAQFGDKRAVATMLGMSVRSVDNLMNEGMPHLKLGARRCRFDLEEVRGWLKERYGQRRRGLAKLSQAA